MKIVEGLVLAAMAAVITTSVQAQEPTNASWTTPVDPELASDLFPGFASFLGTSGYATLVCRVQTDGPPYLCDVVDEAPRGLGFGAAARVAVTSGRLRASRIGDRIVGGQIRTTVRFHTPDTLPFGGWEGPEPKPDHLAFVREMIGDLMARGATLPSFRDRMLDGLDYDRRAVVRPWIEELYPRAEAREKEIAALQLARLFDEATLRRIRAGEEVEWPTREEFMAACPDPTPEDEAAMEALKRRYCERYECRVSAE